MFPRETDALYNKKPAVPAPAAKPVVITSPAPAAGAHLIRKFFITINNRRSEVLVEELS
jgi:hypothetical protein